MADMSRVRTPLELAAASPDPKVRRMAIRRLEMEPELRRLDAFFALYAEEPEPATASTTQAAQPAKPSRTAAANAARLAKPDPLHDAVRAILLERGPLSRDELYDRYMERIPEDTNRTPETLRIALARRKDKIGRVSATDVRYWPVGSQLPSGVNGAALA
jgi:hypothetical protein